MNVVQAVIYTTETDVASQDTNTSSINKRAAFLDAHAATAARRAESSYYNAKAYDQ